MDSLGRPSDTERYHRIKNKLANIELDRAKGELIRARAAWHESGETATKYFMNRARKQASDNTVRGIKTADGSVVTDTPQLISEHVKFYTNLYARENTDPHSQELCWSTLEKTLTAEARQSCEGEITYTECTAAIKKFSNNKSPGSDGLPIEFYKHFWPVIGQDYVEMINQCYEDQILSASQRTAVISTLFKKGDRLDLKNWRPVSLLNCDYKILSKVLSTRIGTVLPDIISPDQTSSVAGRSISQNILFLQDLIAYCNEQDSPAVIISIDQMKAFDRVDWNFLFKTLASFNFGPQIIQWIKLLYTDVSSCVKVNNFISPLFTVQKGVRQGCALSPLTYILVAEVLACMIRGGEAIQGITLPNNTVSKISQYADDTSLTLLNKESISQAFNTIAIYERASGAKVNIDKCAGLSVGSLKAETEFPVTFQITNTSIHLLGVHIGNVDTSRLNWLPKVQKFSKVLDLWKPHKLSLKGKATVINQLATAKLLYIGSVFIPPDWALKTIEEKTWEFFWGGKSCPVKKSTCRLPQDKGGITFRFLR